MADFTDNMNAISKKKLTDNTLRLTWQMQKNLGAAIDLAQAWPLVYSYIQRKFFSPTPRQLIELSAPQPFMYADYYNNYLQIATVGLCFGALQPIILPITAFYLGIEVWFKKYLVQYVFITKTESGGRFWKLLVNRLLAVVVIANAVIALVVGAQGVGSINAATNGNMLYAMIPLPFLLAAFKWYCKRSFDDKLMYYSTQPFSDVEDTDHTHQTSKPKRKDRVAVRFGHPALYKKTITPMVHAKSQHLLKEIYGHRSNAHPNIFEAPHRRSTDRAMPATPLGYSDMYLAEMNHEEPGKPADHPHGTTMPSVEIVEEADLDFENFKKRAEFRDQFGGDGELYGRPDDLISRPGTPSTFTTMTDVGLYGPGGSSTRNSSATRLGEMEHVAKQEGGTTYESGYRPTPLRDTFEEVDVNIVATPLAVDGILGAGRRVAEGPDVGQRLLGAEKDKDERDNGYFDRTMEDVDTSYDRYREKR
jgi:hypothetical protein